MFIALQAQAGILRLAQDRYNFSQPSKSLKLTVMGSPVPSTLYPQSILPKTNPIPYGAVFAVDDDIGLVFSSQGLGFVDGGALFAVFGGNPFIPLAPYRPTVFVGNHVLVPGSGAGLFPPGLKQGGE